MIVLSKANPLFRPELKRAPGHPIGSRVLVRPHPIAGETEGAIVVPDEAKKRNFAGVLIAAGDIAAESLSEMDVRIGDEIWYGQYAGIVESWQHIVREGRDSKCKHAGAWEVVPKRISSITDEEVRFDARWAGLHPHDENEMRECRACGALRLSERVVIMDKEDIVMDVDLQLRIERGETERVRGKSPDGKIRYRAVPREGTPDSFVHKAVA